MATKLVRVDVRGVPYTVRLDVPDYAANIDVRFIVGAAPAYQLASMTEDQAVDPRAAIEPISNALFDQLEALLKGAAK